MNKQNILVTNDDGINAKGLRALIEVASEYGNVTVVAPELGMSGMSHSITMNNPLYLRRIKESDGMNIYACHGTPVDCVKIAVDAIMKQQPTLILSGINHGANSNISVIYSGTMGAASEGCTYGIPSIGFSHIAHRNNIDFTAVRHYAHKIIKTVLEKNDNPFLCLNVNVPDLPLEEIKGVRVAHATKGYWRENFEKNMDPRGREYYWLTGQFFNIEPENQDSDEWLLKNGFVSVVPIQVDMTDYTQKKAMEKWQIESL